MMRRLALRVTVTATLLVPGCNCPPLVATGPQGEERETPSEPGKISSLGFEQFFLLRECGKTLLLDARDSWFYQQGRIPGAINLPADENLDAAIERMLPKLEQAIDEGRTVVVYCNGFGCKDARTVSRRIACKGLNVAVFGGGWKAWQKLGMATESASQTGSHLASPDPS